MVKPKSIFSLNIKSMFNGTAWPPSGYLRLVAKVYNCLLQIQNMTFELGKHLKVFPCVMEIVVLILIRTLKMYKLWHFSLFCETSTNNFDVPPFLRITAKVKDCLRHDRTWHLNLKNISHTSKGFSFDVKIVLNEQYEEKGWQLNLGVFCSLYDFW